MLNKSFWMGFFRGAWGALKIFIVLSICFGAIAGLVFALVWLSNAFSIGIAVIATFLLSCVFAGIIEGITTKRHVDESKKDIQGWEEAIKEEEQCIAAIESRTDADSETNQKRISDHREAIADYKRYIESAKARIVRLQKKGIS